MSFTTRLIQGDSRAYDQFFTEHHQQVYTFCLKLISSEELAEEVMMDVFFTVWKKRKRIDPERPVKSLLYKVARDLSVDCLRKIARERKNQITLSEYKDPVARNTTEDHLITEEYNQLAHQAIDRLPPQRKIIFTMRRQLDMSPSEIAQQLGISKNTVRVQLVRANSFLRDYLATHTDISFFWVMLTMSLLSL
ncbi:MAG: RNA polymerase sigma-70 factor [Bacteroidota bacterium]